MSTGIVIIGISRGLEGLHIRPKSLDKFNPIQTGGKGLWRPYQTLNLNNFYAVKAMTTKFTDFS